MNKTIDSFEETKTEEISADAPKVSLAEKPKRKRRFGDRYDGYRVKKLDTQFCRSKYYEDQNRQSGLF